MQLSKLIDEEKKYDAYINMLSTDLKAGMDSNPKQIPSKYFYDAKGSELFQKITQQDEYYLNKVEMEILEKIKHKLPKLINEKAIDVIELGPGDGHKSKIILDGFKAFGSQVNYYPIDISEKAIQMLGNNIKEDENLKIHGIVADYFDGIQHIKANSQNIQLVLFLGSNIGNFTPVKGLRFLRDLWRQLQDSDYVLMGFDLKKDTDTLNAAYNDSAGYTKKFNLNVLTRINKDLDSNFNPKNFKHYGTYNPIKGAMESFLISNKDQKVVIKKIRKIIGIDAFEPIHLESSYKFTEADIELYGKQSGYSIVKNYDDKNHMFIDSLWKVIKRSF